MSVYLSPIAQDQQLDSNGNPLVGGYWEVYAAGTTTPVTTYTSSTGLTPQAAQIILDASGRPANPIWLTGGTPVKFRLYSAAAVLLLTIDNVSGINDPSGSAVTLSEWLASGFTPTYISATSFSVPGDQTASLQAGRRVRTTNTGGTVYSTILTSVFGALTTVTVANDSGTLDSGLSVVAYGILAPTNPSAPISRGTAVAASGSSTISFTGIPAWVKRVTVIMSGLSTSGVTNYQLQVGAGSYSVTGYVAAYSNIDGTNTTSAAAVTTSFPVKTAVSASATYSGIAVLSYLGSNTWVCTSQMNSNGGLSTTQSGTITLAGNLDRVQLTADTFDAGSINMIFE